MKIFCTIVVAVLSVVLSGFFMRKKPLILADDAVMPVKSGIYRYYEIKDNKYINKDEKLNIQYDGHRYIVKNNNGANYIGAVMYINRDIYLAQRLVDGNTQKSEYVFIPFKLSA